MLRIKLWVILISCLFILLDKFSFISTLRYYIAINLQKQTNFLIYSISTYPKIFLLQSKEQQNLKKENDALKQQIEQDSILLTKEKNQNENSLALSTLRSKNNGANYLISHAIISVDSLLANTLLMDCGSDSDIKIGNPVISGDALIGRINIVNKIDSSVTLITNPNFSMLVQTSTTQDKMLLQGIGNNQLKVKFINKNEKIQVGDILYTTGLDNLYPANIKVARITKIFYENNGFNSALCEPVADFDTVGYSSIITNSPNDHGNRCGSLDK